MKIAVCIKQTPDTEARILVAPSGCSIEEAGLTWIISPHDESALEQALQIRDRCQGRVTAVALGPARVKQALREALAMGADEALHLPCDAMPADAAVTAAALAQALAPRTFDLILTGEQSIDQAGSQVPQRLAVALGWPCVTAVEGLEVDGNSVNAERPREQAEETVRFELPAVVGINRRIGEPRYPSFRGIMKAKRKPIGVAVVTLDEEAMVRVRMRAPKAKKQGVVGAYGSGIEDTVAALLAGAAKV